MARQVQLFNEQEAPVSSSTPQDVSLPNRPDRTGKRLLGAHISEAAHRQFRILAAERGLANNELLREAINDLFAKHGKQSIA
jgi:hypothetical protein